MNIFNRIFTILSLLVLLALIVVVAALPMQSVQTAQRGLEATGAFFGMAEQSYYWIFAVARIILAALAILLFGLLLWVELRRRRPKAVKVHTPDGSQASVTTESVARRLTWHIDQLADVISAAPQVTASGKSVNIELVVETRPEIDIPMKTDEVIKVVREIVVDRMGLQLNKIQVRIHNAPYQEGA